MGRFPMRILQKRCSRLRLSSTEWIRSRGHGQWRLGCKRDRARWWRSRMQRDAARMRPVLSDCWRRGTFSSASGRCTAPPLSSRACNGTNEPKLVYVFSARRPFCPPTTVAARHALVPLLPLLVPLLQCVGLGHWGGRALCTAARKLLEHIVLPAAGGGTSLRVLPTEWARLCSVSTAVWLVQPH